MIDNDRLLRTCEGGCWEPQDILDTFDFPLFFEHGGARPHEQHEGLPNRVGRPALGP